MTAHDKHRSRSLHAVLVLAYYVVIGAITIRAVLPAPATTIAVSTDTPPAWQQIMVGDQKLVAAILAAHARSVLSGESLLDGGSCFPVPRALLLGEHTLNEGLLAVFPYALTGNPTLTYNVVMFLSVLLPGLAMHSLVKTWTGSMAPAFVAGTLFATHPSRLGDLEHFSAIGNYWTVLSLLFLVRLFDRPRWTTAIALGMVAAAQSLESIYPLVPHALICGCMAIWLAARHWRDMPKLVPKMLVTGALIIGTAVVVFGPYLEFRETWRSLAGRQQLLFQPTDFGYGGMAYSGTLALALAVVGLGFYVRRGYTDAAAPYGVLLFGGLLAAWAAVAEVPLPGGGSIPSLFTILREVVPGFDTVRRGAAVVSGWHLVVVVLAGYGAATLLQKRSRATQTILGAILVMLALAEVFVPRFARASFGRTLVLKPHRVAPMPALAKLYTEMRPGAVLDVPYELGPGRFFRMADFVFAGAYHGHRVAACYNSYLTPVQRDLARYAGRAVTDPHAADAFAALGIRNVVLHPWLPGANIPLQGSPPNVIEIDRAGGEILYAITSNPTTTGEASALSIRLEPPNPPKVTAITVVFRNESSTLFRHPDPIVPTLMLFRWTRGEELLQEERVPVMLPTVLIAGDEIRRELTIPLDSSVSARADQISLSRASEPDEVLVKASPGYAQRPVPQR